ncbi:MAG: hypothetical protein KJZ65_14095 [Phycisphaerales bacterium]|nr:hypothetical protein [Phycisphaerales bacterium]
MNRVAPTRTNPSTWSGQGGRVEPDYEQSRTDWYMPEPLVTARSSDRGCSELKPRLGTFSRARLTVRPAGLPTSPLGTPGIAERP